MKVETFLNLPTAEVAQLVRDAGPKVCVFPINGTRRWFMLEYPEQTSTDFVGSYLQITWQRQLELYKLFFDHGIETLLTPIFGPDLLKRGEKYQQLLEPGLLWFTKNQDMLDFYDAYNVRVRAYGDAQRYFRDTPYAHTLDTFDKVAQRTAHHTRHRLFFGICAHDPTETVAEIGVRFHQEHGCLPNKRQIVEAYYGEYVEPVDFFIGFDRFTAFDMPLISTGNEDLYFTVSPSPYLDAHTLRTILYDHLYTRRTDETNYETLSLQDWSWMRVFYHANQGQVLGIGVKREEIWYPLARVNFEYVEDNH